MHEALIMMLAVLAGIPSAPPGLKTQALIAPGSRIRVRATVPEKRGEQRLTGRVLTLDLERIRLRVDEGGEVELARSAIQTLEVSRGRRSRGAGALRGAGRGLAGGAVLGCAIGLAMGDDPPGWFSYSAGEKAAVLGVLAGGAGLVLGAAVGAASPPERWERREPMHAGLAIQPRRGGLGVSLAVSF